MPDYNSAVALGIKPPENDLSKTFNTIANIQQSQAHTGLYNLQALQEARRFNALNEAAAAYRAGQDPVASYLSAGGDPAGANVLQNVFAGQRAMAQTPGGLMPGAYEQIQGAREKAAQTAKIGVETQDTRYNMASRLAGGVLPDPTNDQAWSEFVHAHSAAVGGSRLQEQQALKITDPNQRLQIAQSHSGQGVSPNEINRPVEYDPGKSITTPGRLMTAGGAVGGGGAPAPIVQGMMPRERAGEAAMGGQDAKYTEAVTTKSQTARSVNTTLGNMARDAEDLPVGRGMTSVAEGRAWLQSVYDNNVLGAKSWMPAPDKNATAAYDSLVKNSGQLTRQALMQTHERAAMAYTMIQKQLPNIETSRGGMNRLVAEWGGLNDDDIYKQQVMANRPVAGRSDRFEAEWNKNVNPVTFMLNRLNKEDRATVIAGLKKSEQGQKVLEDVNSTIQFLHANGIK